MLLDLGKIVENPGRVPFTCEPELEDLHFDAVARWLSPFHAEGEVVNSADVLTLRAEASVKMLCICDRCGREYEAEKRLELTVPLSAALEEDDDPDIYPVVDGRVDLDEIFITALVLDMDTKFLCSEDCPGLCPKCGKPLRDGPCGCEGEKDPRLAVLEQLLDQ